jgi:DNA-binding transcriptional regulator YbjK
MVETTGGSGMARRDELADAGVRLIARGGIRALTHRAVDVEADLPAGSTTYYARTRRELTGLVVKRITEQLASDLQGVSIPASMDDATAVKIAEAFLDGLAQRKEAQAVRFALLFELRSDDDLRAPLTDADPVRATLIDTARAILSAIGVTDIEEAAVDMVGLIDALLLYRAAGAGPVDSSRVLAAYLAGLH